MLDRIASGDALSDSERARCRALEAAARDQLVAGPVLDDSLVDAIAGARGRGVDVVVTADGDAPLEGVAPFREVCRTALTYAGPGSKVVIRWRPHPSGRLGSVSHAGDFPRGVVGRAIARHGTATEPGSGSGATVAVTCTEDEDSFLVEVSTRSPRRG